MIASEKTFQSVLFKLSRISVESLPQIDAYLENFLPENETKKQNGEEILSLAGSWDEMSENDFEEYLFEVKRIGDEIEGVK